MIDEICFLDVKKIVVLSIVGKLDDYKREFLSIVKEIKVKKLKENDTLKRKNKFDEHIVPIHFYLGVNLHIPVYSHFNKNIFTKEIHTLKRHLQGANLPDEVVLYIKYRIYELTTNENSKVPAYFNNSINLLEIFVLRDAIGKIDGYKFYQEYFKYFDDLLEAVDKQKDFTQIENIILIIIHERGLINTIKNLLPDLFSVLKNYSQAIIEKEKRSVRLSEYSSLRFYFIINYYEYFDTITEKSIMKIIDFLKTCKNSIPFNFFLYILYTSFTLPSKDIFNAIQHILNNNNITKNYFSGFKSLYNFYRINYCSEKDEDSSDVLVSIYTYEKDRKNHQETLSTYLGNLRNKLLTYTTADELDKSQRLIEAKDFWEDNISTRLMKIINHAKKIGGILESYNESKFANLIYRHKSYNAEKIFYSIDNILNTDDHILPSEDTIHKIRNSIDKLLIKRITNTGENPFCNFVINYKKINYFDLWNEIHSSSTYNLIEENEGSFDSKYCTIKIHECIIREIIFGEIIKNLRLSDTSSEIRYSWNIFENSATLRIENKINKLKEQEKSGRLNGISDMKKISKNYNIEIKHTDFLRSSDNFYIQMKFPYKIFK